MFKAEHVLAGLKQFQRDTVDHIFRRFYQDETPTRNFLVADETGLGKSMIARGLIARTIEKLQHVDSVGRIDIVYVCSNADIAEQNLKRLDVLSSGARHRSTRLTLLARESGDLRGQPHPEVGKRVNLISFTPGTSFDLGDNAGRADERALLHVLLCDRLKLTNKTERRAAAVVLQGWAGRPASNGASVLLDGTSTKAKLTRLSPFPSSRRFAALAFCGRSRERWRTLDDDAAWVMGSARVSRRLSVACGPR